MALAIALRGGDPSRVATPLLAVGLHSGGVFPRVLAALDKAYGGALSRAVRQADFKGNRDETLLVVGTGRGPARVLLVGLGETEDTYSAVTRAATLAGRKGNALGVRQMAFWAP
ncbi:MAG: M17 family peptidase N-terminal domain-containing protein, partial [Gemmatimonadaceae bacterium]